MALTEQEIEEIRKALDTAEKPLFFFDDDPDGVCSFVLLYRYCKKGKGVIVKASPELKPEYHRKVEEYQPDLVVILDKPIVSQEFLDLVKVPVIWLDHHPPLKRNKLSYYNPRLHDDKDNRPTTYWAYKIANNPEDMWLAMIGCVGDWFLPEFATEFNKEYPKLLPENITKPDQALFESKIGELVKILSFNIKLSTSDAMKAVKILTRLSSPDDFENTAQGRYFMKGNEKISKVYDHLRDKALQIKADDVFIYTYEEKYYSLSAELSNELLYRFPDKVIIVGRLKNGAYHLSFRSSDVPLPKMLDFALAATDDGYGGGHTFAVGAYIPEKDWSAFIGRVHEYVQEHNNSTKKEKR